MTYRPLSRNEKTRINQALDARQAFIGIESILMESYEWQAKKEDRPAFEVFLESEKEYKDSINNNALFEKSFNEMTPKESMNKLNEVLGDGENVWASSYEFFYGDVTPSNPIARKEHIQFFNSRAFRSNILNFHLKAGVVIDIDDSETVKKFFEVMALEGNLIDEEKAAKIRALPAPKFN